MSDSKKKILEMLAGKKITAEEALRLLEALDSNESTGQSGPGPGMKGKGKYLRVTVHPMPGRENEQIDRVNVKVPMSLVRAGIKLTSLIPPDALDKTNSALREKGINFDVRNIKTEDIEELIDALGDMVVDVETGKGEKVNVFVE